MPQKESLGYLLRPDLDRAQFITYCKVGLRDPETHEYLIDPYTQLPMRGVVNWLRGNQVFEGNFYLEPAPRFGMLVIVPRTGLPWLSIPGFRGFLRQQATICTNEDGVICGNAEPFLLDPRPDIDDLLSIGREAFEAVPENRRDELNRALRGERGTDLDTILRELGLFNFANPG
jgi:hypothetical protein